MIHRDAFLNKLHALHYRYKSQQRKTQLYRKVGGTHCIFVPLCDLLEDEYVGQCLMQAGLTRAEAKAFVSAHQTSN
jgi:hypothetical protein